MRIRVVWVGRPSGSPYERQVESYRQRVHRRWPAEDLAVRPVGGGRSDDPRRALRLEARAILKHHQPGWVLIALDERGTCRDSEALAGWLRSLHDGGASGLTFAVGSDVGLDRGLLERADGTLSLSLLTLPHQIARLVLWEQLFRSASILGGGAYHRSCVQ